VSQTTPDEASRARLPGRWGALRANIGSNGVALPTVQSPPRSPVGSKDEAGRKSSGGMGLGVKPEGDSGLLLKVLPSEDSGLGDSGDADSLSGGGTGQRKLTPLGAGAGPAGRDKERLHTPNTGASRGARGRSAWDGAGVGPEGAT
jgi:hypothetical protein